MVRGGKSIATKMAKLGNKVNQIIDGERHDRDAVIEELKNYKEKHSDKDPIVENINEMMNAIKEV